MEEKPDQSDMLRTVIAARQIIRSGTKEIEPEALEKIENSAKLIMKEGSTESLRLKATRLYHDIQKHYITAATDLLKTVETQNKLEQPEQTAAPGIVLNISPEMTVEDIEKLMRSIGGPGG